MNLHSTSRTRDVLRAQVRASSLALRAPAIAAGILMIVASILVVAEFLTGGGSVDFAPEVSMVPGFVGALFPIAIWKGEDRFGAAFLWSLPVDRRNHALAKIAGGWACLMAAVALLVLWFLVLALVTSGNFLGEQTLQLLPSLVVPPSRTLDPSTLRNVLWTPNPVFWLVPFTAATGTYLIASALTVGVRHPLRWLVGALLSLLLASAVGSAAHIDWLRFAPSNVVAWINEGPYGLDALLTAQFESLRTVATLASGKSISVWRGLPTVSGWITATLLWIGAGVLATYAAAWRHREQRT